MTATEQASAWCHWLASRGVTLSQDEMREMFEKGLIVSRDERERCKRDVCMYCDGRALGYKRAPDGPNDAGNWTHQYATTMRTEDRVLCKASSIFARERFEQKGNL